ncbi:MAG TPA: hypothetical protein VE616_02820 [Candidatus Udaeobacter sp.]|jgi:hypothetical protein|nr:hypothetical protein [Candidatus Udaeobacter sp.]
MVGCAANVAELLEKGIAIFVGEQDVKDRGLSDGDLISGIQKIRRQGIPELVEYEQVWH